MNLKSLSYINTWNTVLDPSLWNYGSEIKSVFLQLDRAVLVLLIWLIIIFGIFYTVETKNIRNIGDVIFVSGIIGITWKIFNYTLGLYLFCKYPFKIQNELGKIEKLCETNKISYLSVDGEISLCALIWVGTGVYRDLWLPFLLFFIIFARFQAI